MVRPRRGESRDGKFRHIRISSLEQALPYERDENENLHLSRLEAERPADGEVVVELADLDISESCVPTAWAAWARCRWSSGRRTATGTIRTMAKGHDPHHRRPSPGLQIGQAAPRLQLLGLDGEKQDLGELAGAFCCSAGLLAVSQIMNEEMTTKVGPKGRHDPHRVATRNGSAPGSVVLGARTVPLRRPRATLTDGGELHLDSYAVFSSTDLLTQMAMERMLPGSPPAATPWSPSPSAPSWRTWHEATRSRRCPVASRRPPRRRWPS